MTFGASWGARLAHLSHCFKCPCVDFQSPDMFWSMGSVLKGSEGERGFSFFVISAFNLILISLLSFPSSYCQGGSTEKDNCKQTNQTTSPPPKKCFLGSPLQIFWVGDSTELEAKSGRRLLSQSGASGLVGPGKGGHWRGGKVRGRRGKGTFAVQLAALCEAGTVGRYRAGEESEWEAFSSPLVSPPPLCSLILIPPVHYLSIFLCLSI